MRQTLKQQHPHSVNFDTNQHSSTLMDSNTEHYSPPPVDFDPSLHLEEAEVDLEFDKLVAEMQPLPEFNLEDVLGLSGDEQPFEPYSLPPDCSTWEDYFANQPAIGADTYDVLSQFTTLNHSSDGGDSGVADLFGGDVDMPDYDDYPDTEPWFSTDIFGEQAVLVESPSSFESNGGAVPLTTPDFTLADNSDNKPMDLHPIWDFDFSGFGYDSSPPQQLLDALDTIRSQSPSNLDIPANPRPSPLVKDDAAPSKGKGRFYLLKHGKPVLSVGPESVGQVLDAISQSRSPTPIYRPQQLPLNPPLPELNFNHCDVVDGPTSRGPPPSAFDWNQGLATLEASPSAAPQKSTHGANEGVPREPTQRQGRKVAFDIPEAPRRKRKLVKRAANNHSKEAFSPNRGSDFHRHQIEARARAEAEGELEDFEEFEESASGSGSESDTQEFIRQALEARRRARKDESTRGRVHAQRTLARLQRDRIRAQDERAAAAAAAQRYRELRPITPTPNPRTVRAHPRSAVADRGGIVRARRGEVRSALLRSPAPPRPMTRRYARQQGVRLESPDFSS